MARRRTSGTPLGGVHVLLVCDNAERCDLFSQALTYAGALTTPCSSPDDARAVMERMRANVIVVELRVPTERARFIAGVRTLPVEGGGAVPALILTASDDDSADLLAAGYQTHLAMPVRAVELCAAVAALAGQPAV